MATANYLVPDHIYEYLIGVSLRELPVLRELREETATLPTGGWAVPPEFGQLLGFLIELIGARRALELGTFTGYSATCIALALPDDGELVALDVNEGALAVARRYWKKAGVDGKIDLRIGEISDTLPGVIRDFPAGSFDFAFIDADKPGYANYFEAALGLIRQGGLIVFDNVLMGGTSTEAAPKRKYTPSMQAFNHRLHDDQRVSISTLAICDGVTMARKR